GSDVIRPLVRTLVPEAEFDSRPRLSTLSYTGERKTQRLKPRSAVVAFSAAEVYALAEMVRRQRGGAAVVLGALSPRTRNAQVSMYQDGEVDYLVATDAIGMGLNMDVDHVAFSATRKFDGRVHRQLSAPELAQTAGRAGRHMNDGTFGITGAVGPLDADVAARIESHHFEPLKALFWRNPDLDFSSVAGLARSLAEPPRVPGLLRAREADDELAFRRLAEDPDIAVRAATPAGLRLLWGVCQIPDFGGVMSDAHARLLGRVYRHLTDADARIPTDWLAAQVARLDRTDGGIETLAARIAGIRTWTYVSYHADWIADAGHWQERTRGIEDRLSDALHRGLTQRFVDKRTAILVSRISDRDDLLAAVDAAGDITVEGHYVGRLDGFRFAPDEADPGADRWADDGAARKAVTGALARALRGEIAARLKRLAADGDGQFRLVADAEGWERRVAWRGAEVARLVPGPELLKPAVEPLMSDLLETPAREQIRHRLQAWFDGRIADALGPLRRVLGATLTGAPRGLVFQMAESLGTVRREAVAPQIESLNRAERKSLRKLGIRIGRHAVFMPALLKPRAVAMRGLLWVVRRGLAGAPPPPAPGRVSLAVNATAGPQDGFYEAMGFLPFGGLALRVDMAERLASKAWSLARNGPFAAGPELLSLAGCGSQEMAAILEGLGYRVRAGDGGTVLYRPAPARRAKPKRTGPGKGKQAKPKADSPFAKLRELGAAR
ncbi:MAG: helicase-related protein, partial [Rhodospirillales bacterium]